MSIKGFLKVQKKVWNIICSSHYVTFLLQIKPDINYGVPPQIQERGALEGEATVRSCSLIGWEKEQFSLTRA